MSEQIPSFVHGAVADPLQYLTLGQLIDRAAAQHGAQEAIVVRHQQIRMTYSELNARIDEVAAGLVALGLTPGSRIGIWAPNCAEWVIAQFATAKAGLILVNINPAYRLSELEYALNKVECVALITATTFKSSDYLMMIRTLAPEILSAAPGELQAAKLPHLRTVIAIDTANHAGMYRFADLAGHANADSVSTILPHRCRRLEFVVFFALIVSSSSSTRGSPCPAARHVASAAARP